MLCIVSDGIFHSVEGILGNYKWSAWNNIFILHSYPIAIPSTDNYL